MAVAASDYLRWFRDIRIEDASLVGGKNASLGELYRELTTEGVHVPDGFALTVDALTDALREAGALPALHSLLDDLDVTDVKTLAATAASARRIVYAATGGDALRQTVLRGYRQLEEEYGAGVAVAVRSSATAEAQPGASFAGQHDSFLNITGVDDLFEACRLCFASLFTDRAIAYRINNGFDHFDGGLSVGVMKMVRSDQASSGVIFTLDTESGLPDVVLITAAYGLGENVVQGKVDPDEYFVHKPTFAQGNRTVLRRVLGKKELTMTLADGHVGSSTKDEVTPPERQARFCLVDGEVITLAAHAVRIEDHYSRRAGHAVPMDIEWAKDADTGRLFILEARPETVVSRRSPKVLESYTLTGSGTVLATGKAVGEKVATGLVRVVSAARDLSSFRPGEVLVAHATSPDWEPVMKTAGAIVTDHGGRTCHAAIVARELGLPGVVGTENATTVLRTGTRVTICCAGGETGVVYEGEVPFEVNRIDVGGLAMPRTQIMLNLSNPDQAFAAAMMPNAGVGLARMNVIINEIIGIHPLALLHPERVPSRERVRIYERVGSFASPQEYFVRNLAEGVGTIAAAFYPKPVVVRFSDFSAWDYAQLLGGTTFETGGNNAGARGASRYVSAAYADGFGLECEALRRVRDDMGLTNLIVVIPFCRSVPEAQRVLTAMARARLSRGKNGLEIHGMCALSSTVAELDAYAQMFDGFWIGSNEPMRHAPGADQDPALSAFDFDAQDPRMLETLRRLVSSARRNERKVGICGPALATDPDVAHSLTAIGIDAISVDPSSLLRAITLVNEAECRRMTTAERA